MAYRVYMRLTSATSLGNKKDSSVHSLPEIQNIKMKTQGYMTLKFPPILLLFYNVITWPMTMDMWPHLLSLVATGVPFWFKWNFHIFKGDQFYIFRLLFNLTSLDLSPWNYWWFKSGSNWTWTFNWDKVKNFRLFYNLALSNCWPLYLITDPFMYEGTHVASSMFAIEHAWLNPAEPMVAELRNIPAQLACSYHKPIW